MGQHALHAGSKLRNIVFRNQILLVELDHGFQLTVADGRLQCNWIVLFGIVHIDVHPCFIVRQVIVINNQLNQLIAGYECQNQPRYRDDHGF